jgi:hypothetical protein
MMIDGRLSPGEWQDSRQIDVTGVGSLHIQQVGDFVYIAVQYTSAPSGMVDLYVSPREGEIYDLHASAKLGERQLRGNSFPEWSWWNNRDWVANTSRVDSFENRTFLPTPIREFQIRRSRFASTVWRVRFELTTMGTANQILSTSTYPAQTSDKSTAGWLQLDLS